MKLARGSFVLFSLVGFSDAAVLAGVDFEDGSGGFSRLPDDLDLSDGITVSSIGSFGSGWNLANNGALRNDGGANVAGAFEGNFPARLQDSNAFWSITIPNNVILNLDEVSFAVRGATGGNGRDIQFRTSLNGPTDFLYENLDLLGRNIGWTEVTVDLSAPLYQGLTDTTVDFVFISPNGADLDSIVVSGTIVPEPSALLSLGLGVLLLGRKRRS